jgi:AcrR family transcriptional regulator
MPESPAADGPERFEPAELPELPAELALSQLPAGKHGLPRSFVARNQRLRIVAAMLRVLPQHGYADTTIGHVTLEAGVSRAAFYAQFENKEECLLATYDIAAEWLCGRVGEALAAGPDWQASVRDGTAEAMRLLAANPDVAHLVAVEALQAGVAMRRRRQACIERLADVLRARRPPGAGLTEDGAQLLIGGALSLVARYLDSGRLEQLPEAAAGQVALYFLK